MRNVFRRTAAGVTALALCATLTAAFGDNNDAALTASAAGDYNYGEALQKSMFFYQVQQSGPIADWNEVSWRADCMENDFVPGGWFDAGDHIKFTLTNAYAATMLAWGMVQYPGGPEACEQTDMYMNNLGWVLDYLVGCDLGDEIVYMIADDAFDHVWWGSAEVYMAKFELMTGETERPYYTCENSSIQGQMAAALALGYLCFKDSDPAKAETYLTHAKDLFARADALRAIGGDDQETTYYKISSFWDDLLLAANCLYSATGDQSYLDLANSDYIPNIDKEQQSDEMKFTWGHCWDDTTQGALLMHAINTGDSQWKTQVQKHLEYWTTGYGGKQITYTPDGLAWLFQWGSLRHATTTAFLAYVAADELFADDTTYYNKYTEFADNTMNYAFGDNDLGMSFVVGMGDTYPQAWHHRTSSGAWNDKWSNIGQTEGEDAKPHAHVLYGALVGGPDQTGGYTDNIGNYQYTEVAIDYNAGYTAALCAMVEKYGGTSDPSFPPTEEPKWTEFFMRASINQSAGSYTEIKAFAMNHTAWPARTVKNLSYNYYFDITELVEAGHSISDVSVRVGYDQHSGDKGKISISNPIQYDGNIYYVKLSFADGSVVMPTGQSEHRSECQFRIAIPDNLAGAWDATNDYSFQGLVQGGEDAMVDTPYITMYDGDTLIWGIEPDGTTPEDVIPSETTTTTESGSDTTTTITTETLKGDVNSDTKVDIVDLVRMARYICQDADITPLSAQEITNADIDENDLIDADDISMLAQYLANILEF